MKTIAEWHTCKAEEQALLCHCKAVVHRLVPGATLVLYGSRARGETTSTSDFDLLILVHGEILPELGEQIDNALYDIELEYGVVISAIVFNRQRWNHLQPLPAPSRHRKWKRFVRVYPSLTLSSGLRADSRNMLSQQNRLQRSPLDTPLQEIFWSEAYEDTYARRGKLHWRALWSSPVLEMTKAPVQVKPVTSCAPSRLVTRITDGPGGSQFQDFLVSCR